MPCVFCGSAGPMSAEHVAARWAREAVAARIGTGTRVRRSYDGRSGRVDTGLVIKLRRAICESCNNTWLSRMENTVGPWLSPAVLADVIAISHGDMQRTVTSWATKTALLLVLALHQEHGEGFVPESNLRWLYDYRDTHEPPPGAHVWLAAVNPGRTVAGSWGAWLGDAAEHPDVFVSWFHVGHLGFLVIGQDFAGHPPILPSGRSIQSPSLEGPIVRQFIPVWPSGHPVVAWPPPDIIPKGDERTILPSVIAALRWRAIR